MSSWLVGSVIRAIVLSIVRSTLSARPRRARAAAPRLLTTTGAHAVLSALLVVLAACGGDDAAPGGTVDVVPVASVVVSPSVDTLAVGATQAMTALARDAQDRPLADRPIAWHSSDTTVASVSAAGQLTARGAGDAVITATSGGRSGAARVAVRAPRPPVVRVQITPTAIVLTQGGTRQLRAIVRDAAGNEVPGAAVTWETDNAPVARVDAEGRVTAVAPGYATIVVRHGTFAFGAAVTVEAAPPADVVASIDVTMPTIVLGDGDTVENYATPRAANGAALDRPVTWTSADPSIATVDATGQVTGRRPGDTRIVVASEGVTRVIGTSVLAVREFRLTQAHGAALPQTLYTTTELGPDGRPRAVRWDVHDGVMRLRADGVYEQRVGMWISRERGPATQGTYVFRGTYRGGIVADQLLFAPSGDGLTPFSARLFPDIVLTFTQRLAAGVPEVPFVYTMW